MEINLPFNSSEQSMELIKLSALYYDKVNILCPEIIKKDNSKIQYYSQELLKDLNTFERNKIVIIKASDISQIHNKNIVRNTLTEEILLRIEPTVEGLLKLRIDASEMLDGFMNFKDDKIIDLISHSTKSVFDVNEPEWLVLTGVLLQCYTQLTLTYNSICNNQNCISSSDFLSACINSIYKNGNEELAKLKRTSQDILAFEVIPILLPNFYQMSFDDIVDLRYLAKDELQEMRHYINTLSLEYSPDDKKLVNVKLLLENKIRPSIKQLESKVYGLKAGAIQRALQGLKDPKTYTPLLTTFFTDIPTHISLAVSMGLIVAEAGLEYLKQKKEIETNPLYFSVKLKKISENNSIW